MLADAHFQVENHKIHHFPSALSYRAKNSLQCNFFPASSSHTFTAMSYAQWMMQCAILGCLCCSFAVRESIIEFLFHSLNPWCKTAFMKCLPSFNVAKCAREGVKKECQFYCLHTLAHLLACWCSVNGGEKGLGQTVLKRAARVNN
jgi:hypothetical protein